MTKTNEQAWLAKLLAVTARDWAQPLVPEPTPTAAPRRTARERALSTSPPKSRLFAALAIVQTRNHS